MGLLEQRAKAKKTGGLSVLARKAASNGNSTSKLSPLAAKAAKKKKVNPLVEARARRALIAKASSKLDFHVGGILFHNCVQWGNYWMVDVSNGDETVTFHNRYSAWFTDVPGDKMKEPPRDIHLNLQRRYLDELASRGIPNREQRIAARELEAREKKKRTRAPKQQASIAIGLSALARKVKENG